MVVQNRLDRFHLAADVIDYLPSLGAKAAHVRQALFDKLVDHERSVRRYGQDMPELRDWSWTPRE